MSRRDKRIEPRFTSDDELRDPVVGDVTIVPFPEVRKQVGCAAEAGILMEDRRNVLRVFFPTMDRTFWLERDGVAAIPLGRIDVHPLVDRLHRVARRLDAVLIESEEDDGAVGTYYVYTPELVLADLEFVRDLLDDSLVEMKVEAGSVRRVKLRLTFRY